MSDFNAQRARAKRPCPLWVDAFQRDTQHLGADEVGAYMLILMAMWTRESCDFPDDDTRLANVSRVSPRLWKSRLGPVLRPFFKSENGALTSKRLREEAAYVERQVTQQSNRKTGEKNDKPLSGNDTGSSVDMSPDNPRDYPSQLPNYPTEEGAAAARAKPLGGDDDDPGSWTDDRLREEVMAAVGLQGPPIPTHWMPPAATVHVGRWRTDLGLDGRRIVDAARANRARHTEPPNGPKALDAVMRRLAAELQAEPLRPEAAPRGGVNGHRPLTQADLLAMVRQPPERPQ